MGDQRDEMTDALRALDALTWAVDRLEYLALARAENASDRNDAKSFGARATISIDTLRAALSAGAVGPAWGVWVDYNRAPPGSYACLVSSFVDGKWTEPDARWMPAQGRPHNQGQVRIMPHLMPGDPLTRAATKET